jgi:hypothetical protein
MPTMKALGRSQVESLPDFVALVKDIAEQDLLLCRGHREVDRKLTPTLARLQLRAPHPSLPHLERRLVRDFERQSVPYLSRALDGPWDVLAVAQHHGLATRLLDWTANPLAALWFAVREEPTSREHDRRNDGAVWFVEPSDGDIVEDGASPFDLTDTKFFRPRHLNARIVAQQGWFSAHALDGEIDRFIGLDPASGYAGQLKAVTIPAGCFADVRGDLDRLAVNQASMFPDLDGLSRHLNWLDSVMADE